MKWFLVISVTLVCSVDSLQAQAPADLYAHAADAFNRTDYATAAPILDQLAAGYPNMTQIDDVRIQAGLAHLYLGDFTAAVAALAKEAAPNARPEYRGPALYYTGLAQLSLGEKLSSSDKAASGVAYRRAVGSLTDMFNFVAANPTPANKDLEEDAYYYRALAQYRLTDYPDAERDILTLLQNYGASLKRPDYLLLLGSFYETQLGQAIETRKSASEISALADKAIDAFDKVSRDPNALIQANDANLRMADILYIMASRNSNTDAYQKALDAYHLVRRKDDMIPLQQAHLDKLREDARTQLQNGGAATVSRNSLLINREEGRLNELKNGTDPILQALVRIAECYNNLNEFDEARTVLHRLSHVTLPSDQQQEVDFQTIFSYVRGGQSAKADAALNDYLAKHPGDPQAEGISVQIANNLLQTKDYTGALAQAERSLRDFPKGRYVPQALQAKADALNGQGKHDEAKAVLNDYIGRNPQSPVVAGMLLSRAEGETAQGDLNAALADFQKAKDISPTPELQAAGTAGYIQTLNSLLKFDDVIRESQDFATKFPDNPALAGVLVLGGIAMDKKNDPGAVAVLQSAAQKYPKTDAAPYALYYVVTIYQREKKVPEMLQAATDMQKAFPAAYPFLTRVADMVGDVLVKQKKFDDAAAQYQPLLDAPDPSVAAAARNKTGAIWYAAAKAMGSYQSMQKEEDRAEVERRLSASESSYVTTLKSFPDQLAAMDDAFKGLDGDLVLRRGWGVLKDPDMEAYLAKITADLTSPDMLARVELAKAGLVFVYKNGESQYPAALDRFRKATAANSGLHLTRMEANRFGELLVVAKDYPAALQVYTALLAQAAPDDQITQADGYYGLGATYLAQGDMENAKANFTSLKSLNGGAVWHPHILDANFGLALATEASDPAGAKETYGTIISTPQASPALQAKAMLGYGRLLEKEGHALPAPGQQDIEYGVHYYLQVDTFYGPALPALSAEGLFDAAQAYARAGDKTNAFAQYKKLTDPASPYAKLAPDWVAKAQAESAKLGP